MRAASGRARLAAIGNPGRRLPTTLAFALLVALAVALAAAAARALRTLALPDEVAQWTLTTLREKLIKVGARIVRHGRYVVFQLAEVVGPHTLFAAILYRIDRLRQGRRRSRHEDRER